MQKTLIIIPTYNEKENIGALLSILRKNYPEFDILVIDDNSPDKTSKFVADISGRDNKVRLLLREKKEGLGKALFAGYRYAVENKYEMVVQMDADFSHPVSYISEILKAFLSDRIVICSRHIEGGGSENWSFFRIAVTIIANFSARILLSLKVKDLTSGFRAFPGSFLKELLKERPLSGGYLIQVETVIKALKYGYKVIEIPFVYQKRKEGVSKLGLLETLKSAAGLVGLTLKRYN